MATHAPMPEIPLDLERLAMDAVDEILRHEDYNLFLAWILRYLPHYFAPEAAGQFPQDLMHQMAAVMGRALWNVTPLPGNGFRPRPAPTPDRNLPCPCGSGQKFKKCCALAPAMDPIAETLSDLMSMLVHERIPDKTFQSLLTENRVPLGVLIYKAESLCHQGKSKKAVALLEPLFLPRPKGSNEDYAEAFDALVEAYNDLDRPKQKIVLIQSVIESTKPSPLRARAWQRLMMMDIENENFNNAWNAFAHAQQDNPDDVMLGHLEIQLLTAEHRMDEARSRADFWRRRCLKLGLSAHSGMVEYFTQVSVDPLLAQFNMEVGVEKLGPAVSALRDCLARAGSRPLPHYSIIPEDEATSLQSPEEALRSSLRGMGVSETEIEAGLEKFLEPKQLPLFTGPQDDDGDSLESDTQSQPISIFQTPKSLHAIEAKWQKIVPVSKPFSISESSGAETAGPDLWDPDDVFGWLSFFEKHPEAFDSLNILDDLANIILDWPSGPTRPTDAFLLEPVLKRAIGIVELAQPGKPEHPLAWIHSGNRVALRPYSRMIGIHMRRRDTASALALAARLVELNPNDNHGYRTMIMDDHLQAGRNNEALELAGHYPADIQVEIQFGRILALYSLGRVEEAGQCVPGAVEYNPHVVRHLIADKIKQPRLSNYGVSVDGEDAAWIYRQAMRQTWMENPGALDWLAEKTKAAQPGRKGTGSRKKKESSS